MPMVYEHDHENDVIYFGKVNFRNGMQTFGIKTDDRRRHTYVIGKTGMGKTTLLENMILADIYAGHGCCYVDPHGDMAEKILDYIPSWRINDVVYFNPGDMEHPTGFNILESVDENMKHLVAAGMMGVFKKIWEGVWSARMEYILNNTILALMDTPGTTLLSINRMLSDKEYRARIVGNVKDPIVKQFWIQEFGNYQDKFASEAVAPIQNKVGQFLSAAIMRNVVAQAKSTIDIRRIMDDQKIFIVNLSKGRIGEDASRLLGGMLITKIQMAAMERVDMPEEERQDFYLYVDEFQNFAVESFASILSEARKYRLNLIMAHQYIAQLTEEVRDAVFGNVGTIISFRVGSPDAGFMEEEWKPRFTPEDLINLPKFSVYLKLMIDGVASQPFSAFTLPPIAQVTNSRDRVIAQSRERYAGSRSEIEAKVAEWSGFGEGVDMDAKYKEVSDRKKAAKKERYATHKYDCTRCNKNFGLPVELDRNRPIYCSECKPIIDEERKNRKEKGHKKRDEHKRKEKRVVEKAPKVRDGVVVGKESKEEMSLSKLSDDKKKEEDRGNRLDRITKPEERKREEKVAPKREEKREVRQEKKVNSTPAPSVGDVLKRVADRDQKSSFKDQIKAPVENKKEEPKMEEVKKEEVKKDEPKKTDKEDVVKTGSDDGGADNPKRKRKRRRRRRSAEPVNTTDEKQDQTAVADKKAKTVVAPGEIVSFD